MPPRNPELPEGTDHIITGAMATGAGSDASTGSTGAASGIGGAAGGASGGLSSGGGSGTSSAGSATGGSSGGGSSSGGSSSGGGAAEKLVGQVRSQVQSLTSQATDKVRQFADDGKNQVSSTLSDLTEILNDAARSVDARLGEQYGQYAHRAVDAVTSVTESFNNKSIDDLLDDTRSAIRKSPTVAVGTAAVLGFALMRVVKAGLPEQSGDTGRQLVTTDHSGASMGGTSAQGTSTQGGSTGGVSAATGGGSATAGTGA